VAEALKESQTVLSRSTMQSRGMRAAELMKLSTDIRHSRLTMGTVRERVCCLLVLNLVSSTLAFFVFGWNSSSREARIDP